MNGQKKRIVIYFLLIIIGFGGAYVFLRKQTPKIENTSPAVDVKKDSIVVASLLTELIDLENNGDAYVSSDKAATGKRSCKLSPAIEYGVSVAKTLKQIPGYNTLKTISITFKSSFSNKDPEAVYVLSIDDSQGKNIFWDSRPIVHNTSGDWAEQSLSFTVKPEFLNPDNKIVVYPWNKNKNTFYVDDIIVEYIGTAAYKEVNTNTSEKSNLFFDFESAAGLSTADNVKETTAHSGKLACDMKGGKEYGPSVNKKLSEIGPSFPKKIGMSVWVYPLTDDLNLVLTSSVVNSKNETVFWEGESSENKSFPKNKWTKINASYVLPTEKFSPDDVLGVGIWNKGKTDVIVDDLEIVYGESAERRGQPSKVDPVSIYEKRFVPVKNKPPFKTIWLEKQPGGNELDVFSPGDVFIAANFDNDKKNLDELLCVSKKHQALYTYDPSLKQFKKIWENKNSSDPLWNADHSFAEKTSGGKISLTIKQSGQSALQLVFDGKAWITSKAQEGTASVLKQSPVMDLAGSFTADKQQILKLDRSWRFDLKLWQDGEILGNVDFTGYAADHNPKYYEFVTLVSGRFIETNRDALLVVMANCADVDFDGYNCNALENSKSLPNSTQLYSFGK